MEILIISGLSGAGKSSAATYLEDMGYYTVDNVPADIILKFAEFCAQSDGRYDRVALVSDIRSGNGNFQGILDAMERLKQGGDICRLLFVTADLETIIKRYKETRRRHPLMSDGMTIEQAMHREQELLLPLREHADFVIDTTLMPAAKLRNELYGLFGDKSARGKLSVNVVSFGFKYGIPLEADLVFDVRFLPNPFYVPELKHKTGMETVRSMTTCSRSRRRRRLSTNSRECSHSCFRSTQRKGRARSSSPSAARAGTTAACPSRAASRPTSRPWAIPRLKITATSRAAEASF